MPKVGLWTSNSPWLSMEGLVGLWTWRLPWLSAEGLERPTYEPSLPLWRDQDGQCLQVMETHCDEVGASFLGCLLLPGTGCFYP